MLKLELYQLSPAPVTLLPAPFLAMRALTLAAAAAAEAMACAPWLPWVPPLVMVKTLFLSNVGGPVGAEVVRDNRGRNARN